MKSLKHLTVIIALFFFLSCNNDDNNNGNEPSSIKIGSYIFKFETEFTLEELQGIDSYVGNIKGSGISLFFDYGWYTGPPLRCRAYRDGHVCQAWTYVTNRLQSLQEDHLDSCGVRCWREAGASPSANSGAGPCHHHRRTAGLY